MSQQSLETPIQATRTRRKITMTNLLHATYDRNVALNDYDRPEDGDKLYRQFEGYTRLRLSAYLMTREGPLYEHYDAKEVRERVKNAASNRLAELVHYCIIKGAFQLESDLRLRERRIFSREVLDSVRSLNIRASLGSGDEGEALTYDQVVDCFPQEAMEYTISHSPTPISSCTNENYPIGMRYRGYAALLPRPNENDSIKMRLENLKRNLCIFQAEQYHALHPDVPMNKDLVLRFRELIESDYTNSPIVDYEDFEFPDTSDAVLSLADCYGYIVA